MVMYFDTWVLDTSNEQLFDLRERLKTKLELQVVCKYKVHLLIAYVPSSHSFHLLSVARLARRCRGLQFPLCSEIKPKS